MTQCWNRVTGSQVTGSLGHQVNNSGWVGLRVGVVLTIDHSIARHKTILGVNAAEATLYPGLKRPGRGHVISRVYYGLGHFNPGYSVA